MPAQRKYPFPTMALKEEIIVRNPPRWFANYVWACGERLGRKFRTQPVPGGRKVVRVA